MNVYGYNPKVGLKHACIVSVAVAYTEPQPGQAVVLILNHVIEIKGLNHHLLCPMQCCMNSVLANDVPKFLAPIPSETMHAIQIAHPFDATHPIIILLKSNGVTSYFDVRQPT